MINHEDKHAALRPSTRQKVDNIIESAREKFFANGFAATSIESIAAKAGVSKVTVYSHFGDKEKLFTEMLRSHVVHLQDNFKISNLEQKSLRDILTFAGLGMLNFLTQKKMIRFERMLGAEVNRDPKLGSFFLEAGPKFLLNSLEELLEASVQKGEIHSDDIAYSAELFPSLVMGRMDMMMRYGWDPCLSDEAKTHRVERAVNAWMAIHKA